MSIINQTLRELDARRPDPASPQPPLRPAAIAKRRRTSLWGGVAALLPFAGLAIWLLFRPAAESLPRPHAGAVQHAAIPVPRTPPVRSSAVPAAHALAKSQAVATVATNRLGPVDSDAKESRPPASLVKQPGLPATTESSAPAVQLPVIRKEPNQPTAREEADERYRKALTLIRARQEDQARPLLEAALELSPGHVPAREALAALLSGAGHDQEAEKVLRIGRTVSPEHTWFALGLARLQAARGDTGGAVATLQSGMEGRGVNAEYHATLAALLVRLRQYPDAVRQYEQALGLESGQGTWWMGLGLSLEAQGKDEAAQSAYRRALEVGNLPSKLAEFVRSRLAD